jgi:cytoskeletal protein CcmA (bactofilin family)
MPFSSSGERDAALSIIGPDLRVEGEMVSRGVVKVEGTVVGSVRAERQVLVAKGGTIEGDVTTQEAVVGGVIAGTVTASARVEVQEGAVVNGDIVTKRLVVMEGGEVNGHVRMADAIQADSTIERQASRAVS